MPNLNELTLTDKEKVVSARDAYEALTSEQRAYVTNLLILLEAEAKIIELEEEQEVNRFKEIHVEILSKTIDTLLLTDKEALTTALAAYNELPQLLQTKVGVEKALLDNLFAKIEELEQEQADKQAIETFMEKLSSLPSIETLTLTDKEKVVAAKDAYGDLTEGQRSLVNQEFISKLETLESKITELEKNAIKELNEIIEVANNRIRPEYTESILEWDNYWDKFISAKENAEQLYADLVVEEILTLTESTNLLNVTLELKRSLEILAGIEDFDLSFGARISPKGLEKTVNDQSITTNGDNRLRVYYDNADSTIHYLLSKKLQGQSYLTGSSGIGLKTGLINVMKSEAAYKLQSDNKTIQLLNANGTRKTDTQLDSEGGSLALAWVGSVFGRYSSMVGKSPVFTMFGKTSDGTEFQRTYTFRFIDGGVNQFDPAINYYVEDGVVYP